MGHSFLWKVCMFMEYLMTQLFQEELLPKEQILWAGQPDPRVIFTRSDIFLIPFSLLWGGFAIFWEINSWEFVPFRIFGFFFVIIGLYFIFGRFIYKIWRKTHTYYCVTDRRLLILTTLFRRNLQSVYIDQISTIEKSIHSSGRGSLYFGNRPSFSTWYSNSGLEFFFSGPSKVDVPSFYDIPDAQRVYQLIIKEKNKPEHEEEF